MQARQRRAYRRPTSLLTLPSKRKIHFPMELTVGITGASGAIYAHRTLVHLAASGAVVRINLILSDSAKTVGMVELGFDLRSADEKKINEWIGLPPDSKMVRLHRLDNMAATPSSGSHPQAGMIIVPCSMGTLGAIASGAGTNLIHRAADVTLKEGRKLVIVPARNPLQRDSSRKHAETFARRSYNTFSKSRFLSSATNDRSVGRSPMLPHSRPIQRSTLNQHPLERRIVPHA